jgi:hypothetical protein
MYIGTKPRKREEVQRQVIDLREREREGVREGEREMAKQTQTNTTWQES